MDFDLPGMDTRTLSEAGAEMVVRRLDTGAPLLDRRGEPVVLLLRGPDGALYRALQREQVKKRLNRAAAAAARGAGGADAAAVADGDEDHRDATEMLARLCAGWRGVNTPDGEPIPCTTDTARSLFERYPAIRDQADAFVVDRRHFTTAPSAS